MVFLLASSLLELLIGPIRLAGHGDLVGPWQYLADNTHDWRSRLGVDPTVIRLAVLDWLLRSQSRVCVFLGDPQRSVKRQQLLSVAGAMAFQDFCLPTAFFLWS